MTAAQSGSRYTAVAIFLHWIMALGIIALAVIGLTMTHVKLKPHDLFKLYQLHKSIGITILLAAFLRLAWRLVHRPPSLPAAMPPLERKAAGASHLLLYGFLFVLPMTGWAVVSAAPLNIPTVLYGLVPWPHLPILSTLHNKAPVDHVLARTHDYLAFALIALVTLHAAAALRHHLWLRDDVLTRMLPHGRRHQSETANQ
ncbi:MAG: cytochrome b [Pseudomonadota bacterium]